MVMKKILSIILTLIVMVVPVMGVSAEESNKINFYIFYGNGCGFCEKLHKFTAELEKDKEYNKMFNIVDYEVWKNQENSDLMVKVGEYFGEDVDGVPFYVIGDKHFSGFSEESSPAEIKAAIKAAYENKDYVDIVAGIGQGTISKNNSDLTEEDAKKDNNMVGYILLGITAVIVVAIIFGRSNATYYPTEEQMIADVLEEVEEKQPKKEVKKATKSSTTKKTTSKSSTTSTKKATTKKASSKSKK